MYCYDVSFHDFSQTDYFISLQNYNHQQNPANSDHLVRVKHINTINLTFCITATKLGYIRICICFREY